MLHLHFTKWTPETEVQLSPAERRWRLFKQQGGSQINTFLVLKVTSKGWQWEGSQGAISYLFVLWSDLSLDKVPGLITVSVLRSNQGPLQMFSRLEVPDVGEGWRRQLVLLTGCWRPLKCFVRFEISRISSSDVCRNWKLCFLTLAGHFNESIFCAEVWRCFRRMRRGGKKSFCCCLEKSCNAQESMYVALISCSPWWYKQF